MKNRTERFRMARNIDEGYEVHVECPEHWEEGHWLLITSALHLLAPIKVSSFVVAPPNCMPELTRCSAAPSERLLSRRPS